MSLINFLLDNIVLVFIIIGGVFSFFNRVAEENKKRQQPPAKQVRKEQGGANQEESHRDLPPFLKKIEQQIEMAKEQMERRTSIPANPVEVRPKEEVQIEQVSRPNIEKLPTQDVVYYNQRSYHTESPITGEFDSLVVPTSEPSFKKMDRTVNKNKIREAIIWAEILGPPRAKRSLHSKH